MNELKILVIQTAFTGDVILATPVFDTLLKAYPLAAIDVMVRKGNESLLRNFPGLRRIIIWDKSRRKFTNLLHLLPEIRREKYDHVINLQRFASSGLITVLSGAGMKTGFDKNPFSFLFDRVVKHSILPGNTRHETDRNLELISHLAPPLTLRPVLYPSPEDERLASTFVSGPYVTFAPASVWFTKQLPADKWITLATEILKGAGTESKVFLIGGPADTALCENIRVAINDNKVVNLAGTLTFLQTAALMKNAVMNYVNDSAPLHIASAMNAPVTAFFCSTVPWFGFGPLSSVSIIAETPVNLECKPCGLHGYRKCPLGHFKCAHTIEPQTYTVKLG